MHASSGNVHSADGWHDVLAPVVARYRGKVLRLHFRADAAFAMPGVYEFLKAERIKYAIRIPTNRILQARIGYLLPRPVGRPPNHVRRFHASFTYQAGSWTKPRRGIAKVEWHPGELVPRVGFIVTNLSRPAERVVAFYNQRGRSEQWIKEGKGAIKWTRLSCRTFAANAVRLQLHALAYNLGNFLRTLATPEPIKEWSLTSLREKLVKIGAKLVSHGRYVAFQMAEVAVTRRLFAEILRLIADCGRRLILRQREQAGGMSSSGNQRRAASWRGPNWSFRHATCRCNRPPGHLGARGEGSALPMPAPGVNLAPKSRSSGGCRLSSPAMAMSHSGGER